MMWKNKLRRLLSIILTLTLLGSHWSGFAVQAESKQVVYVSASGDDNNNGTTAETPVSTLAKVYELLLSGDVKTNAESQGVIVVMDELAAIGNFNYGENGELAYTHAGKITITGSYGGQTYENAALVVDVSANRYFQCGGPTVLTDLTVNASGSKHLYLYGGESFTMTSTVTCTGGYIRVHGGYSYASGVQVENAQLDLACNELGYVYGSEGLVTGDVVINLEGTKVTKMLSAGTNSQAGVNPKTATVNIRGEADIVLFPINGYVATDMTKVIVNLYGGIVRELRSGRGRGATLGELELNVYNADSIPQKYKANDTITNTTVTLSGVTAELSAWNFPSADTIKLTGNTVDNTVYPTKITYKAAFPVPTTLIVEEGCELWLDEATNTSKPEDYTGGGTVKWIGEDDADDGDDTGDTPAASDVEVIYVASTGSDTNAGLSADAPVATLTQAYEIIKGSTTVADVAKTTMVVVMDELAAVENFNYNSGALIYTHAGKVIITGKYDGTTYESAGLSFNGATYSYFQCGGPTEISDLTLSFSGKKQLYIYGSTALTLTSTVTAGNNVRVHGGYSYASGVQIENAQLDLACDKLGYVYGSEGLVTGNVVINLDGTDVTTMLSAGANYTSGCNPKTATVNICGDADIALFPINGNVKADMTKVTVNLYGGTVQELRSGRGKGAALEELELNVYSADSIPNAYLENDAINKTSLTLSGVTAELFAWNFPSADTIKLTGNTVDNTVYPTKITLKASFPATSTLIVEEGSELWLDKTTNDSLPNHTGGGIVAWIDGGSGDDATPATAVEVVYVASTGADENDGLTISTPVKTLEQAYKIIRESTTASDETATTTIVLMDVVELTENFIGDVDYTHKGTVKITSQYNDLDYRENGAKLRINMSGSKVIAFGGPTILKKVKFARINVDNASYVTTNLYTGPNLRLGEEVKLVGGEGETEVDANKIYRFQLRSGNYSTESGDVNVHMSSGSCYFLMAASNRHNVNGNVVITVDGTATPWYITGGSEAEGKISGTVTINVSGESFVRRVYAGSTYEGGPDELCTVNISGGTVAVLAGGRAAGTHLNNLVVNVSGEGSAPAEMSLKNTKGGGTIDHFTLSLDGQGGTYSPDWSLFDKLIVKGNSHIAVASLFENVELEVESGSSVFLAAPNETLPEWTGLGGAAEKGDVWLEERDTQLGDLLLSVDFEDGAKDLSSHGRDGVIYGDVKTVTGMDGGKAVFINNETGETAQQYIDFGSVGLGDDDFTISFWMKTTMGGTVSGSVSAGTPYDMSTLWPGLNAGVLLSNQRFDTPDYNGFSLINAGCYMYFGSSLMAGDNRYQIDSVKEPTDDRWHQIVVTVTRKGMEHIYVDGKLCSSVFIGDSDGQTIDAENGNEHLILGADGLGQYGVKNVTVDDLRIYSGVMSGDQIQAEAYLGQTLNLVRELKERGVTAGNQYSQSAIDEIMSKAEVVKAAAEKQLDEKNYDVTQAESLYRDFRSAYEQFLMGKEALASFIQISDTHVESIGSARYEAMQKALNWANELGIDACLHSGDYSNNGTVTEIEAFWDVYKNHKGSLKTFMAIGNHEVRSLSSAVFSEMHIGALTDVGAVESGYDKLYYEGEVNGYHILVLSAYIKDYPNYDGAQGMEAEQLQWLDEKLAAYCNQGKPVFVLIHPCVTEQLEQLGQYRVPPTTITPESIYDIFAKYPDAVVATGHIHHGLGDGSGVFQMQSGYHVLDIPAFLQNNSGYGTKSTEPSGSHHVGYFTYVYEDVIQYRAVDFATGEWLTAYDQTIKLNANTSKGTPDPEETTEAEETTQAEETTEVEETTEAKETTEAEETMTSEEDTETETPAVESGHETSNDSTGTPDTGDNFRTGLWMVLAFMTLGVGVYVVYLKKRIVR